MCVRITSGARATRRARSTWRAAFFERDVEKRVPQTDTPLFLYCGGGYRSILAAATLQEMGYSNVVSVQGGWRAWEEAGAPVERPRISPEGQADGL